MDYIYGFNSSQYLYFLTVQKKSYLPGKYLSIDQSETRILSLDKTYGLSGIRMKSCDSMLRPINFRTWQTRKSESYFKYLYQRVTRIFFYIDGTFFNIFLWKSLLWSNMPKSKRSFASSDLKKWPKNHVLRLGWSSNYRSVELKHIWYIIMNISIIFIFHK